ncbi:MAG: choline dehydrogenase-like flavoprotein [Psychroserpens sp.]|jgi:choline dehydrogenase-like flavoprotein
MMDGIFEYTDISADSIIKTQVCIIGSGCGGATLAKKLTDAGIDVVVLERGGYYPAGKMDQRELNMAGKISQERNLKTSHDGGNVVAGGNNIGGASVHYWADSYRTPQFKLDEWANDFGVIGHNTADLKPAFDEIEQSLNIHAATDEYFNRMNEIMRDVSKKLGWHGHRVPQARKYCLKSGHCMQGCMYDAKQSQVVTHLPTAIKQGAKVYADAEAAKFVFEGDTVKSLIVDIIDRARNKPNGLKMVVHADQFVVAAGGFNTPFFLMQQGLKEQLPELGKNLSMNPSSVVHGIYDEKIILWRNIPAAYGVDEFLEKRYKNNQYQEGGYILMANQIQPALLATFTPGFGEVHQEVMANMSQVGGTISWIDDIPAELGEIQMGDDGTKTIFYEYGPLTQAVLKDSLTKQITLQFAAGAKKVIIAGHQGITFNSIDELAKLDELIIKAGGLFLASPHPGGGCRMGSDASNSVVDSNHKIHGLSNVYVADSSVFPTSSALDPSLTIMAFSYMAAKSIVAARAQVVDNVDSF